MEIERKFLLSRLPDDLGDFTCYELEQAYISTNPVIRVRKKICKNAPDNICEHILTVKSGGLMVREEFEIRISEEGYLNLLNKAEGNIISKDRYIIPLDQGLRLELDIFKGAFDGLVLGEVEFEDEESAKKYNPPSFISEDVTFNKSFSNSAMSKMSKEEISELLVLSHKDNR